MKKNRHFVLPLILLVLLLAAVGCAGYFYWMQTRTAETLAEIEAQLGEKYNALMQMENTLSALKQERDDYLVQLESLERKMSGVEEDALLLEGEREELTEQIKLLRVSIEDKNSEIAALEQDIADYNTLSSGDVRAQAALYEEIITALEKEAPMKRIAKFDEDGNAREKPKEEILSEDEKYYYVYPSLALYYVDLERDYCLNYRADETFYSASLIKAPYILWLLEEISREEEIARANAEAFYAAQTEEPPAETAPEAPPAEDVEVPQTTAAETDETTAVPETTTAPESSAETTGLDTDAPEEPERPEFLFDPGKEIYDLSRTFVYTEESFREGSGSIQDSEFGTEYTYRELVDLAILKSDNVAFGELRNVFGYGGFYGFNTRLGINSVRRNFNSITAKDMAIYLREMYTFIEENEDYGPIFRDLLCRSAHSVLIPYAVYPTQSAHKYGWDENAYHDAAIVYNEHPYLLVVLTDLDHGGTEVDTYIRRVVKLVDRMHRGFYS